MNMTNLPDWFGIMIVVVMVLGELLFFAFPALLWALIGRQKLTEAFAWRQASGREYLGAALLALGCTATAQVLIVLQSHVWPWSMTGQKSSSAFLLPLLQQNPLAMTLALPLSAAFGEELFFRGVLQRALVKRLPAWAAIGLGSVLFSAVHLDVQGFAVRVLFGALLGVLVLRGLSIFPAMLTHFLYDAALFGSTAWYVHYLGLSAALHQAGQANGGAGVRTLAYYGSAGLLLSVLGWGLSVSAWRRKQGKASEAETMKI